MARIAHRASFLQAFHTATSETARKAWIESPEFEAAKADLPEFLDEGPNGIDGTTSLPEDNRVRNLKAGQTVGRGSVRKITPAQAGFILKLINERDLTGLNILPGQTINPKEIPTMGVKGGSALIEKLLNCPIKSRPIASNDSVRNTIQGSEKQIAWITKTLIPERNLAESDITNMFVRTQYKASAIISELLAMPKAQKANNTAKEPLTEGMYVTTDNKIFKVYENQEHTRILCKELIDGSFEYLGMAQYKLPKDARKMTLDEAKAYGKVTGTCCVCSRRLTDEGSIEAGIGPVCASKF
jgi:hypothetical protein